MHDHDEAQIGMTFNAWRQRARIVRAIERLSVGETVSRVAADARFASTMAFSFACQQVTATTPTACDGSAPPEREV